MVGRTHLEHARSCCDMALALVLIPKKKIM
jgi:hypothetical protein